VACGKYIARMDADDIAHPDRLQLQVDYLSQNPKVDIVGSWIHGFGDVRREYIHRYPLTDEYIKAGILFENPFAHPTVMIRRSALENLDHYYSSDFPYVEDWELWTRLIQAGKGSNISMPLLKYRIHAKSSSQRFTQIQSSSKLKILQRIYSDAGLPFSEEFVLGTPKSNGKWLYSCFEYYKQIQDCSKSSQYFSAKALSDVLQVQLVLRARQIAKFGISPAWFIFRHRFTTSTMSQKLLIALRVLFFTNAHALITLLRIREI
jgi:glycosyltransferase involved in cell wall biosynthesis